MFAIGVKNYVYAFEKVQRPFHYILLIDAIFFMRKGNGKYYQSLLTEEITPVISRRKIFIMRNEVLVKAFERAETDQGASTGFAINVSLSAAILVPGTVQQTKASRLLSANMQIVNILGFVARQHQIEEAVLAIHKQMGVAVFHSHFIYRNRQ